MEAVAGLFDGLIHAAFRVTSGPLWRLHCSGRDRRPLREEEERENEL